ncbi:MAG: Bax inhibitor-1 family protein [Planctomycetota bacterium]
MRRFSETMAWPQQGGFAIDAAVNERLGFLRRTYGALLVQLCLTGAATSVVVKANLVTPSTWPIVLIGGLIGILFVVPRLIQPSASKATQWMGAGLVIGFFGFSLAPLVLVAPPGVLLQAFILTAAAFTGLTLYVVTTRKDFSAWGGALWMIFLVLFGIGVLAMFGGFALGNWYSIAIVLLFSGFILYDTSNILHRFPVNAHMAASVTLLIDFVILFKYIAILLMSARD